MTLYHVEITENARLDMECIYDYIAIDLQSPEHAINQYNRIADIILTLDTFPERHKIMDEEPGYSRGSRLLPIDNYIVVYEISGDIVYVTNVFYGASDIIEKLKFI